MSGPAPHEHPKNLRTEDGVILEVQEGLLLDADGEPLQQRPRAFGSGQPAGRVSAPRALQWKLPLMAALAVPLILFAGFAIVGVVLAIFLSVWLIRGLLAILGLGGSGTTRPRSSFTYVVRRGK